MQSLITLLTRVQLKMKRKNYMKYLKVGFLCIMFCLLAQTNASDKKSPPLPSKVEKELVKLPPIIPLFDHPVRDTSICLADDGYYYLTGTTGNQTGGADDIDGWWYVNEGIRVWKSPDLQNWQPLGLVWSIEKDGTWQKQFKKHDDRERKSPRRRALWAPEIHYLKGTFWLTFCMNYGGTGLLKSTTGKAEGPYVDVHPQGPITDHIDASLFADDDGSVYFVWQNGLIARMKNDLTGLAEKPRLIKPANRQVVGFEGAFLFKANGRYYLSCAEFNNRGPRGQCCYDCMVASADKLQGPWGDAYLTIPHGGHNVFFRDKKGDWWATFFGHDSLSPVRERPAILAIEFDEKGLIRPKNTDPIIEGRWSPARAQKWYESYPWLVGCNFIPSTAINQLEMWQADTFDPETIDCELAWAAGLGFNVVRVYLHDLAYAQDPEGFLKRVNRFLSIADSHDIKTMLVIFDDCWLPNPKSGKQPAPWPGVHNSGWLESPGLEELKRYPNDPALRQRLEKYVKAVLTHFRKDRRILMWDLYNEAGGWWFRRGEKPGSYTKGLTGTLCLTLLRDVYIWARRVAPSQPLTTCWNDSSNEVNEYAALNWADVVTFHHYGGVTSLEKLIDQLQKGAPSRPLICTEYLRRGGDCLFQNILPVLQKHNIGAVNWGLVSGKTNTIWSWTTWDHPGLEQEPKLWHHDIFRPNGSPYSQEELDFLRKFIRQHRRKKIGEVGAFK